MTAANLHRAVTDALTTLDAIHRPDPWANQCLTCGPEGGRWPCASAEVADDLRDAVGEGGRSAIQYGWTRHGHAIPGVVQVAEHRPLVARCGGPRLCSACALDVAQGSSDNATPDAGGPS